VAKTKPTSKKPGAPAKAGPPGKADLPRKATGSDFVRRAERRKAK
jgi:hypothetical protein